MPAWNALQLEVGRALKLPPKTNRFCATFLQPPLHPTHPSFSLLSLVHCNPHSHLPFPLLPLLRSRSCLVIASCMDDSRYDLLSPPSSYRVTTMPSLLVCRLDTAVFACRSTVDGLGPVTVCSWSMIQRCARNVHYTVDLGRGAYLILFARPCWDSALVAFYIAAVPQDPATRVVFYLA